MRRLAAAALLLAALPAAAQTYKCVDERGRVRYSDQPLPGCQGGAVNIRPIPPLSGEREHLENLQKAQLEQRCARARQELGWLSAGTRLSRIEDSGERVTIDDATRDKRIAELRVELRGCP